ncbi:response regulator [Bacillus mesophilum]|uniref:Circadian input-output histidine kinase CikA n=1 Tax=Bacillus mesophilum TaxID=1071718 RepID=A0A7V7UUY8_9BACI|nr:response regulator [Bacillus mesophilum]KAB2331783.1 response regulator [Bacillus mesophilum]
MSFKRKQFIGLGLTTLFLFLLMFVILMMVNVMRENMLEIVQDRYSKVNEATEIRQEFYEADRMLLNVISYGEELDAQLLASSLEESHHTIESSMIDLERSINTENGMDIFNQLRASYDSYLEMEQDIIQLMNEGNEAAVTSLYSNELENRDRLLQLLAEFKDHQEGLMNQSLDSATNTYNQLLIFIISAVSIAIILIIGVTIWVIRSTSRSINSITKGINDIDYNELSKIPRLEVETQDEIGDIAKAFNYMAGSLEDYNKKEKKYTAEITEQNWIQSTSADIIGAYSRFITVDELASYFIKKLTPVAGADLGIFYLKKENGDDILYKQVAAVAGERNNAGRDSFAPGEGLIGQTVLDMKITQIRDIPDNYRTITTGLGEFQPRSIVMAPILMNDEVVAVIELAGLQYFTNAQIKLIEEVTETLGIAITNIAGRMEIVRLLQESQAQTEELQTQSEELQTQSEELQAQSEEMQTQAEELRIINEQLEERTKDAELKSEELLTAKEELEEKAKELTLSSKYKSEFLANMSHELRTPLNSILLLSEMLEEDPDQVLTDEQKEFSRVIHTSGQDLLNLINDILDLSKVEVGKLEIKFEEVNIVDFADRIKLHFAQMAKHKGLDFTVSSNDDIPMLMHTDEMRLQQVVKNLLSNAFKFTEEGSVTVLLEKAKREEYALLPMAEHASNWLKIIVSDTGIGIAPDKQKMIFEAFQQADGATMRKYGGTGLGLSITREFATLLGGTCKVERSVEGEGSSFALIIPSLPGGMPATMEELKAEEEAASALAIENSLSNEHVQETIEIKEPIEKAELTKDLKDKTVIVVDDDNRNIFALKNALEKEGMNVITASNGLQCIDSLVSQDQVDIVLMDIMMPVMDGYETMKRIRGLEQHHDVPIIALTAKAMKGDREKCIEAGASDYISKPLKLDQLLSVMRVWIAK